MMCYLDKTFCPFHEDCVESKYCGRALTDDVQANAVIWWGGKDAPICVYAEIPKCHRKRTKRGK